MTQQTHATISVSPLAPLARGFAPLMQPDTGWRLLVIGGIMLFLAVGSKFNRKGKLTTGRWAGPFEKVAALNAAMKQLRERKKNSVTVYVGTPRYQVLLLPVPKELPPSKQLSLRLFNLCLATRARLFTLCGYHASYFLPDAERGIFLFGSPGSGKTFSLIDPLARSVIDQGFSVILYDVKGEQMKRHIAYAIEEGYEVYIFAPGYPYSGCLNLLDFLKDKGDSSSAYEIARVITRNARTSPTKGQDEFFGPAGDQLLETVMMLAKDSPYADILMAWKILSLPKLAKRLRIASEGYDLDLWAEISATSIMSVADAERTVSGIVGTAVNVFSQFVKRDFLPSLVGKSTIPLRLDGKQMLVFQIDEKREAATVPLVGTAMHMIVRNSLNNQTPRQNPVALICDEFPSLYVPDSESWFARFREYGSVPIISCQNEAQVTKRYGKDETQSMMACFATQITLNPNHEPTAAARSKDLGEKEVMLNPRSHTHGKQHSVSQSEQIHRVPLMTADRIGRMEKGEVILKNPAFRGGGEGSVPWHIKQINLPENDKVAQERSIHLWNTKIEERLIQRARKSQLSLKDDELRVALQQRASVADWQLPSPEEVAAERKEAEAVPF